MKCNADRLLKYTLAVAFAAVTVCGLVSPSRAAGFPTRTVKLICPVPPGGSVDTMARIIADKLQHMWKQSVIVENRPGGANVIGIETVLTAAPDGYTLLFGPGSPIIINKLLYPKRPLDPDSLVPVSRVATNPILLVVNPHVPAKNLSEFVAYAKANPGKLNYATAGEGGVPHLTAEMFERKAGVTMTKVPYRGVSIAMTDLVAGQVDLIFVDISTAIEHIRAGRLRALGVAAEKRNPVLPDIPALTEYYPDLIAETWFAMAAPPKTPPAIVDQISRAVAEAVKAPDVEKRMKQMGEIEGIGSTPAQMAAYMKTEKARWADVIQVMHIKGE